MRLLGIALVGALLAACGDDDADLEPDASVRPDAEPPPEWLVDPRVEVVGVGVDEMDCRTKVCQHNENTDLINFDGAIYLVHRTAVSQVLGPNSSLRVYRSDDGGETFTLLAIIPALADRDIRDPHFYIAPDGSLMIKTITRIPHNSIRDTDVESITYTTTSTDLGQTWSDLTPIAPVTWGLWRVVKQGDTYYSAAYEDGDLSVVLYSSTNGVDWTAGAQIYGVSADTPLETELVFMPSGRMLALVRMDGNDDELLGDTGRLRTQVCWATAPYDSFDCPQTLEGVRLDGPLAFWHGDRLFVVAREHLQGEFKKRTTLYEITGNLEGGPIEITSHGRFPSAGDTAYAGMATVDENTKLISWYSGELAADQTWVLGVFQATDIWLAKIDFTKL
jgi:hypothetical protein